MGLPFSRSIGALALLLAFISAPAAAQAVTLVTLNPSASAKPVGAQQTLTARLTDDGAPLAGEPVVFAFADNAYGMECNGRSSTVVSTDSDGRAACVVTWDTPGTLSYRAFHDADGDLALDVGEPSATASIRWLSEPPAEIAISPAIETMLAGTHRCVDASVTDAAGAPTMDRVVRFSVAGDNAAVPAVASRTKDGGVARFCYTGLVPGTDVVTAYADTDEDGVRDPGEPEISATRRWLAAQPTITLAISEAKGEIDLPVTLTASVSDAGGAPLEGVSLIWRDGPFGLDCDSAASAVTDGEGIATCTYTQRTAMVQSLSVTADTNGDSFPDIGEPKAVGVRTWVSRPPATIDLAPAAQTVPVDETACVTATVKDTLGTGTGGRVVVFSVTGVNPTASPVAATTDFAGRARYCAAGTVPGQDTITAFADIDEDGVKDAGEPEATAVRTWVPSGLTITLTPAMSAGSVDLPHTVTATVTSLGVGVPDVAVTFERTAGSVSGFFFSCTPGGSVRTTAADGTAQCTFSSPHVGTDTIRAFLDTDLDGEYDPGEPAAVAHHQWVSGPAAEIELFPRTIGAALAGTERCINVFLRDARSAAAAGRLVRYAVNGANAQIPAGSVRTDLDGGAQICLTGTNPGVDTIVVYADNDENGVRDDGEPGETVTRYWLAAEPAVAVEPASATATVGTPHRLTVTTSVGGEPVEGVQVYAERQGSPASECVFPLTSADGRASCEVSSTRGGTRTYLVFADTDEDGTHDSQEGSATAEVIWQRSDRPASLVLRPGSATRLVEARHCVEATVRDASGSVTAGWTVRFAVAGPNPATGAATTDDRGKAAFCTSGANAGTDAYTAYADTDSDEVKDADEPGGTAVLLRLARPPSTLTLTPAESMNPVGTELVMTATVTDAGTPIPDVRVRFGLGGLSTSTGSTMTDAAGKAVFTVTSDLERIDAITAYADVDDDDVQDAAEPSDSALAIWTAPMAPLSARATLPAKGSGPTARVMRDLAASFSERTLDRGRTAVRVASEAGTLLIELFTRPRSAAVRPVTLARGRHVFAEPGRAGIVVRSTPAGRRLARRGRHLRATVRVTFKPATGGRTVVRSRALTLR
jgi:hypothetical protein